jgi:hypothetical protein
MVRGDAPRTVSGGSTRRMLESNSKSQLPNSRFSPETVPRLKSLRRPLTSPTAATGAALVQVLKGINPLTGGAYGPLLDAWVRRPGSVRQLVAILRSINPMTVTGYGPLLDAWLLSSRV